MRSLAPLLLLPLGACKLDWSSDHSRLVIDGYEMTYERTAGLVLGDLTDAHLVFDCPHGDVQIVPVEGESRVIVKLREAYPRDGSLVFVDGLLTLEGTEDRPVAAEWVRFEIGQPLHSARIATDHGDVDVESITVATELSLHTGLGDVSAVDLGELTRLEADSGLGDINVTSCAVGQLEAASGIGDIELDGVHADHAVLRSGLGDVEVDSSVIELLDADTGLGDVDGDGSQIGRVAASTGLGKVDIDNR